MASGYEAASADLKAYAGLEVEGRQIQRMLNLQAPEIARHARQCSPAQPVKAVNVFYIGIDGTGVPMMPEELESRAGKQEDGSAKTREVKLGCVFTQQIDRPGKPPPARSGLHHLSVQLCLRPRLWPVDPRRSPATRHGSGLVVVVLGDGAAGFGKSPEPVLISPCRLWTSFMPANT